MAPGSRFRNAIGWLGLVDDDRYVDTPSAPQQPDVVPVVPEARPAPTTPPVVKTPPVAAPAPQPVAAPPEVPAPRPAPASGGTSASFVGDNSQTMLLTAGLLIQPSNYDDIQPIADRYRGGLVTIMNLRIMSVADARRSLDFFSGVVYALQGSIRGLRSGVFLLVPVGARIDQTAIDDVMAELR